MSALQTGAVFMEATRGVVPGAVALIGAGYDGTTSFRPGTRLGPAAIRAVSEGIETYSPRQDRDLEDILFCDAGDLDLPFGAPGPVHELVEAGVKELVDVGCKPLMLGGEHSLTSAAVRAVASKYPDLVVVQFDAHADLRQDYLGERRSHACAMRRSLEALSGDEALIQVGIRSGTREEWREMRTNDWLVEPSQNDVLRDRLKGLGSRPIYLTIDLDVFDPAYLPGTGTPEPGGIDSPTFERLLDVVAGFNLVAADVMELSPKIDTTDCSSVLAAKVVREVALVLSGC